MSDVIAMATLQTALQMGLRVPEDLRIVGFDGIPEAQNLHPTITTVQQHSVEKGRRAARMFLEADNNENVVLPTELLIGESCP
jgi:DNA-binding LacI/PurR family transcriptional regulator